MYLRLAFTMFSVTLFATFAYAQNDQILCSKCMIKAKTELNKCLEAAISREDKESCVEKNETQTQSCSDGVCQIEKAARGNASQNPQNQKGPPIP